MSQRPEEIKRASYSYFIGTMLPIVISALELIVPSPKSETDS
jgi:hypothetical protein